MKKLTTQILLGLLTVTAARADTALMVNPTTPYGCLQNASIWQPPLSLSSSFTLPGVSGIGVIESGINASAPSFSFPPEIFFFHYAIDLSGLPAATNHCVKLLIHFGAPQGCDANAVWGDPSQIQSATLAPFGDITFTFAGGCLMPSQPQVTFTMYSEAPPKTNIVTVIDAYVDPASGTTNEARINVQAIVPDIPPNPPWWVYYHPIKIPATWFQGDLANIVGTNQTVTNLPINGKYDLTLQLLTAASNSLVASETVTQSVPVINGLFTVPLPGDPVMFGDGSVRYLNVGARPSGKNVPFTPLNPPLPITPTPQAFYAYTAGSVADLAPGQAVTSLNGLADAVNLQAGSGIILETNGNTLTISAQPGVVSDRSLKTDFAPVKPANILAKLAALPIDGWRYTNEIPGIRHVGPMAQDFRAAFGLGHGNKMIEFVDEEGVALAAIQGLNQKLNEKDAAIRQLQQQNDSLEKRLDELEIAVKSIAESK